MIDRLPKASLLATVGRVFKPLMGLLSRYSVEQEDLIGVDIAADHIRVAQLSKKHDQWVLEKLGYRYFDSEGRDINALQDKLSGQLRELAAATKLSTANAAVAIPITSAIVHVITVPLMSDEELGRAVETNSLWANTIQLTDVSQYSIFWQTIRCDTANNTMSILFVASKLADINAYTTLVSMAGLNPMIVDVRCFATRNAFKLMPSLVVDSGVVAVLEIGSDENYLLIVHNDAPFISDIYLSEQDRMVLADANADDAARMEMCERYVSQAKQAILAFQGTGDRRGTIPPIERLQIVSTLPHIENLLPHLQSLLDGYHVELFDPLHFVRIPENLKDKLAGEPNPSVFTSVLGLATRKVDVFGYYKYVTAVNNINLLPDRDNIRNAEKKKVFSGLIAAGSLALVLLIVGIAYWIQSGTADELLPEGEKVAQIETRIAEINTEIQSVGAQVEHYRLLAKAVANQGRDVGFAGLLLAEIARNAPQGVILTEIVFDGENSATIKGTTRSDHLVHQFVEGLRESNLAEKVELQNITQQEGTPGGRSADLKEFDIRCLLARSGNSARPDAGGQSLPQGGQ